MERNRLMSRPDAIVLCIIMILYSALSFYALGDTVSPQTQPDMAVNGKSEYVTYISLEEETELSRLMVYKGLGNCGITVYKADEEGESWEQLAYQVCDNIYSWEAIELDGSARLFCISVGGDLELELFEAGFITANGAVAEVITDGCLLFDEQEFVPNRATYSNGMIFDESYHARTAYEYLEGIKPYETSHPPLGKLLISAGISLFGMTPFGWRFMGNVFGIMMLAVMYVFAKRLFKNTYWATVATLFFSFDFMHFTQTRTALIDSFAVFFILLMTLLMFIYYDSSVEELPYKKSLILLAVCGAVFGLGIATKWIAVYSGAGLAILFTLAVLKRRREGEAPLRTCLWCLIFFVAVPLCIYFLSYIPHYVASPDLSPFKIFWDNQKFMLTYHGGLESVHTFESKWYTWPLIYRPIWYYGSKEFAYAGLCSTVVAMGNPAVWWCGSISSLALLVKRHKSRKERFILIALLTQYLPWALISRSTFIYHFFASVPFVILALVSLLKSLSARFRRLKCLAPILLIAAAILFLLFYPVISGYVASRGYVLELLTWFDSWKLCY